MLVLFKKSYFCVKTLTVRAWNDYNPRVINHRGVGVEDKNLKQSTGDIENHGSDQNHSEKRRVLLKGAIASVPVVMALANRPAWGSGGGGGNQCWSGIQSGNLSQDTHDTCDFGRSPGYYKNNVFGSPGWPTGFDHGCDSVSSNGTLSSACKDLFKDTSASGVPGTQFGAVFTSASGAMASKTLMQILWQDSGSFEFHAIATYFNTLNFHNYSFNSDDAKDIINDILAVGSHTDNLGHTWSEQDMKDLFASLYHPSDP